MLMLVLQALVAAIAAAEVRPRAVAACTGASTKLPADQCAASQAFWDGAGGAGWTGDGAGCTRTDPCQQDCGSNTDDDTSSCNGAGTTVIYMCVPAPARTPPPRSLRRSPRTAAAADLSA